MEVVKNVIIVLVVIVSVLILVVRGIKGLRLIYKERGGDRRYSLIPYSLTVMIQLLLITMYANIIGIQVINNFNNIGSVVIAIINLIVVIPYNIVVSIISGYKMKRHIIVGAVIGSVITMSSILGVVYLGARAYVGI